MTSSSSDPFFTLSTITFLGSDNSSNPNHYVAFDYVLSQVFSSWVFFRLIHEKEYLKITLPGVEAAISTWESKVGYANLPRLTILPTKSLQVWNSIMICG